MNRVEPRTLPGFMELMPNEQILFNEITDIIRNTYESYSYLPLDTPVIEYSEVLLAKAGGETEKQIYRFNKGDTDLSLRFDLTVPLAKYVAKRYNDLVFPFKRYQIGKVFRGERPQKGRFREFYQCDIDVIGNEELSLIYDAEMPSIIYDIFKKLNFGDFVIQINNRKILSGFFEELNLKNKIIDILRIIDKIDKIGTDKVINELKDLSISNDSINKIIDFINIKGSNSEKIKKLKDLCINNDTFINGVSELEFVINKLNELSLNEDNYEINLTIARGLDYYTGTIYETKLKEYPGIGSVCSGGRYEDLASYYTDKKLPGVGISIGLTRLFDQLESANIIKPIKSSLADVVILPMTNNYSYIYNVANMLRKNNIKTDICYLNGKFKQLIRYADKQNVSSVIIIGDNEIEKNIVLLKNMETGNQKEISINNVDNIKEYL